MENGGTLEGKQLLIAARRLIEDQQNWCQFNFVREETRQHCAVGAVIAAKLAQPYQALDYWAKVSSVWPELNALADAIDGGNLRLLWGASPNGVVASFNNESNHSAVIAMFDRAIASLDNKQQDQSKCQKQLLHA